VLNCVNCGFWTIYLNIVFVCLLCFLLFGVLILCLGLVVGLCELWF
jgi:hypothetical protein